MMWDMYRRARGFQITTCYTSVVRSILSHFAFFVLRGRCCSLPRDRKAGIRVLLLGRALFVNTEVVTMRHSAGTHLRKGRLDLRQQLLRLLGPVVLP